MTVGDDAFLQRFRGMRRPGELREIPKSQRRALAKSLVEYRSMYPDRNQAMARAYGSGAYTMKVIRDFFGVHYFFLTPFPLHSANLLGPPASSRLRCEAPATI